MMHQRPNFPLYPYRTQFGHVRHFFRLHSTIPSPSTHCRRFHSVGKCRALLFGERQVRGAAGASTCGGHSDDGSGTISVARHSVTSLPRRNLRCLCVPALLSLPKQRG